MLFRLSNVAFVLVVLAMVAGATAAGIVAGRSLGRRHETIRESVGAAQGALLGFVALLLAFGLTMAVGRYEADRAAVVNEANAVGTAYLRAQTLPEPLRSQSLLLLRQYTDSRLALSRAVPSTGGFKKAVAVADTIKNQLWGLAGAALDNDPSGSATRLYVESLNDMIDMHSDPDLGSGGPGGSLRAAVRRLLRRRPAGHVPGHTAPLGDPRRPRRGNGHGDPGYITTRRAHSSYGSSSSSSTDCP